jgi:nucleoside-diphosphate-sugar epimerase
MHVMIIGAAGMIGQKLAISAACGQIPGLSKLTLSDCLEPPCPPKKLKNIEIICQKADFGAAKTTTDIARSQPDVIYLLAAVVSGETEADFDKGYATNVTALADLLVALKQHKCCPRLIFTSSLAIYGPPLPAVVPQNQQLTPASSYGTQKVIAELLIADYTRKGFIDGLCLRLPTIVVRPGKPNAAASSFMSSIIREPLSGHTAKLPVPASTAVWLGSPTAAIANLVHAARVSRADLGQTTSLNVPGLTITVQGMINALEQIAGSTVTDLIIDEPDQTVENIVCSWPAALEATTAEKLGFRADASFLDIIGQYREEYLV